MYIGLIDPMTGEGIHTAMESGKIAASVLEDAFTVGNFDSAVLEEYQNRWLNSFGTDFYWYAVVMEIAIRLCKLVVRLQSAKLVCAVVSKATFTKFSKIYQIQCSSSESI